MCSSAAARIQQGFSMVEMVCVVAIIAILAAVAVPVLLAQKERADHRQVRAQMLQFALVAEAHYLKIRTYNKMAKGGKKTGLPGALWTGVLPEGYRFSIDSASDATYSLKAYQGSRLIAEYDASGARGYDTDGDGSIGAGENSWPD